MSVYSVNLKTHSQENITDQFPGLNKCKIHGYTPLIFKTVAGKRKETFYTAICVTDGENNEREYHDECGKIGTESGQEVVDAWNKWNP